MRGASVGAVLWVSTIYLSTRRFRELAERLKASTGPAALIWDTAVTPWAPRSVAVGAATGAVLGAACVVAVERAPLPRTLSGAGFGLFAWATLESMMHLAPKRQPGWFFDPPIGYAAILAGHGAAVY
jgi:hypothetical protein